MKLTKSQARGVRHLKQMKEEEIDFTDIPELINSSNIVVGRFYRPLKKSLTIRIDVDVVAWVKQQGKGYQTRINSLLREAMNRTTLGYGYGVANLEGTQEWKHSGFSEACKLPTIDRAL